MINRKYKKVFKCKILEVCNKRRDMLKKGCCFENNIHNNILEESN